METKTKSEEQQGNDSISQSSSSSRSSSITSDSSDGHFDIRHFPIPKPSLSAAEAQKQRESHQAYNSSVSSYTGSSWSSVHQNHLADSPGYDSNRIPSSVFSSKPANSMEWSIASNESLFSIHDGNFSISTREDHGVPAGLRLGEIPRFEEPVHEITEIKPVPLPLPLPPPFVEVKKPTEPEKETITEKELNDEEESYSESNHDDQQEEKEMIEPESDQEHEEEEEEDMLEEKVEKIEEKEVVEHADAKENKAEDTNSTVSHSPTISCRSDTSNNSTCSFAFPVLQNEDGVDKTPSLEIRENVSQERRPEYLQPQSPMQPPQPEPLPHSEFGAATQLQPQAQLQRKASNKIESEKQSPKTRTNGCFSCFHCPLKCWFFK